MIRNNELHESALLGFVERAMDETPDNRFLPDLREFAAKIAPVGALNSLAQLVVKITAPGVPDFYQGTELWSFSLVDPDNRRPVDFRRRQAVLDEVRKQEKEDRCALLRRLTGEWTDGAVKMFVTQSGLEYRKENAEQFETGDYMALEAEGEKWQHVLAFARRAGEWWSVTIVPRWTAGLVREEGLRFADGAWGDTRILLPEGAPERWKNVFSGEELEGGLEVGRVLGEFPVGLLESIT